MPYLLTYTPVHNRWRRIDTTKDVPQQGDQFLVAETGDWYCLDFSYGAVQWIDGIAYRRPADRYEQAVQRLKEDAMRAEELFGVDECERYADQLRKEREARV
jgi:hypothetical protein